MVRARPGLWPVGLCWQVPDPAPRCFNPHDPVWNVRPELLQGALHSLQRKNTPLCLQSDLFSHFSLCSTFPFTPWPADGFCPSFSNHLWYPLAPSSSSLQCPKLPLPGTALAKPAWALLLLHDSSTLPVERIQVEPFPSSQSRPQGISKSTHKAVTSLNLGP